MELLSDPLCGILGKEQLVWLEHRRKEDLR